MAVASPLPLEQLEGVWQIDPSHTTVQFAVKHMAFATVRGRFNGVRGTITLRGADLADSAVEVEIDVTSIETGDQQRDQHLRSADFFDVERFPKLLFRSTRVRPLGDGRFEVLGLLTIRDVTREVRLDASFEGAGKDPWGNLRAGFSATTAINRKEFGLTWNQVLETGGVLVSDEVKISLELEAVRQAA